MTDKEKFNFLLEFFIKQWEENALQGGASGGTAAYGRTWAGRAYENFKNHGFSEDLIEINDTQLHFTFSPGLAFEQNGRNYVNWEWLNIIPNITKGTRKIVKLSTIAVQTPKDDTPVKWMQFKKSLNTKDYCSIPVDSSKSPMISSTDLDNLYNNFFQLIHKFTSFSSRQKMKNIVKLLQAKQNLVLTGAPGTGKTYKTAEIAVALIDGTNNLPSNRVDLMKRYKELVIAKQIAFTTFHQSLDYEEFVEGLKPEVDVATKKMTYQNKDGIFKEICDSAKEKASMDVLNLAIEKFKENCSENIVKVKTKSGSEFSVAYRDGITFRVRSDKSQAQIGDDFPASIDNIKKMYQGIEEGIYNKTYVWGILEHLKKNYGVNNYTVDNSDKKYLLIIDEINRGNISKIFGELITLLEKDKRLGEENEIKVTLPYSQKTFGVPSNLFIIGTMNTADRSIGHIDYAIRRRFAFISLKSSKNVISNYNKYESEVKEKAEDLFDSIKEFLYNNINADLESDDLMIGHSYFLCKSLDDLKMRLDFEIIPLIQEYEKDGIIMPEKSEMKIKFEEWRALLS